MDTRLHPLGNSFLNEDNGNGMLPQMEVWNFGNLSWMQEAGESVFKDSSGGGVIVRRPAWRECRRRHSIPNHIPWRMRMLADSNAFGSAGFSKPSVDGTTLEPCCHTCQSSTISIASHVASRVDVMIRIEGGAASGAEVMTHAEGDASRLGAAAVRHSDHQEDTLWTWADVVDGDVAMMSESSPTTLGDLDRDMTSADESKEAFVQDVSLEIGHDTKCCEPLSPTEGATRRCVSSTPAHARRPCRDDEDIPDIKVTTLMIRNIPVHITQPDLLRELEIDGFQGHFDFCYMPCSFNDCVGKGYAFINFRSVAQASRLAFLWHRARRFDGSPTSAALTVRPAAMQGLEANLRKWGTPRISRIRNPKFHPFVARQEIQNSAAVAKGISDSLEITSPNVPKSPKCKTKSKESNIAPQEFSSPQCVPAQYSSHSPGPVLLGSSLMAASSKERLKKLLPQRFQ